MSEKVVNLVSAKHSGSRISVRDDSWEVRDDPPSPRLRKGTAGSNKYYETK